MICRYAQARHVQHSDLAERTGREGIFGVGSSIIASRTSAQLLRMAKKQKFLTEDPGEDVKMPQTKVGRKTGDDAGADSGPHRRHRGHARSVSSLGRHLLWSARKRGHGASMEVLDGRSADALRDGLRGAVLQRPVEDEGEQSADCGSRTCAAGHRSLAETSARTPRPRL